MTNILINPSSGMLEFNTGTVGGSVFDESISGASRFHFQNSGELNLASYGTGVAEKFTIDSQSGRLLSIDTDFDSLFSANDVAGLPILEVYSDGSVIMGDYNSGDLVLTGNRVGIGTAAPNTAHKLHVQGVSYATGAVIGDSLAGATPPTNGLVVEGNVSLGGDGSEWINGLNVYTNGSFGGTFYYYEAPTDGLIVEGNVGIGTYAPSGKLHVDGAIQGGFSLHEKSADFTLSDYQNGAFINGTSTSFDQITISSDLGADFNTAVLHSGTNVVITGSSSMIINGIANGVVTLASGYQPASIVRLATNTYGVFGNLE